MQQRRYKLKNLEGEDIGLKSIYNQSVKTCIPIDKNITFRVTLTGIKSIQARDSDDLADFGLALWVTYEASNGNIKNIDKDIFIYKNLIEEVAKKAPWSDRNIIAVGNSSHQIHVKEGTTKKINNSIVFDVTPRQASDKRARFKIFTWLKEYTSGGDKIIANDRHINVDIYNVLAALLDPDSNNEPINNGADGAVMKFVKNSNGLEGSIEFGDNTKETYVRIKVLFEIID